MRILLMIFSLSLCVFTHVYPERSITSKEIFERFYIVHRLHNAISVFSQHNHPLIQNITTIEMPLTFNNELLQNAARALRDEGDFKPLLNTWNHFASYKWMRESQFTKEFATLIYLSARYIHDKAQPNHTAPKINTQSVPLEILLEQIDTFIDNPMPMNHSLKQYPEWIKNLDFTASHDDIALRFYHIKRLERITRIIKNYKKDLTLSIKKDQTEHITLNGHTFTHPYILFYIEKVSTTHSTRALNALVHNFAKYKHIQDKRFVKEYATLLLIIAASIFNQSYFAKNTFDLESIDEVPLEAVLDVIDMLSQELPELLEKYEFDSDMPWKQWLKKYWWAPAIVGSILLVKSWLILKYSQPAQNDGFI